MQLPYYIVLLIALAVIVVPVVLGNYLARMLRMPDYGWKLAIIFFALFASVAILVLRWPPKLGIDLSGGVRMIYQVDQSKSKDKVDMSKLTEAVSQRLNTGGLKETQIRPAEANRVEITIPNVTPEETAQIKDKISRAGTLEFRILANDRDHKTLINRARAEENSTVVFDSDNNRLGWWVPLAEKGERNVLSYPEIASAHPQDRQARGYGSAGGQRRLQRHRRLFGKRGVLGWSRRAHRGVFLQ